jgi:hypothetical protein
MTTKNTYNPEDLESLLMTKVFADLLPVEKKFVMQHIDSKEEYNLLRTTLFAIKKSSKNDELIEANPQTKEELLLLMQSKGNRGAWFNLNGLWSFLFPTDVFFVKKPGFQLASYSILLIFGFNLGNQFLDFTPNNLAINKTEPKIISIEQGQIQTENSKSKEVIVENQLKDDNGVKQNGVIIIEEARLTPSKEEKSLDFETFEDVIADGEAIELDEIEEVAASEISDDLIEDDFFEGKLTSKVTTLLNKPQTIAAKRLVNNIEVISVSSKELLEKKKDSDGETVLNNLQSQSLADDEAIIDLLYVTL